MRLLFIVRCTYAVTTGPSISGFDRTGLSVSPLQPHQSSRYAHNTNALDASVVGTRPPPPSTPSVINSWSQSSRPQRQRSRRQRRPCTTASTVRAPAPSHQSNAFTKDVVLRGRATATSPFHPQHGGPTMSVRGDLGLGQESPRLR